jgi:membrane protease YdiL (CAAX protease family)
MNKLKFTRLIVIFSPIIIIILGNFAGRISFDLLGKWAWIGYFPFYWFSMFLFIVLTGKKENRKSWFQKPQGSIWWTILAIVLGLMAFPIFFIPNIQVLSSFFLIIAWIGFAVINSIFEESYWRAFLLDEMSGFSSYLKIIYTSVLFTAIHPLNLGIFSRIQSFNPERPFALVPFIIILFTLSVLWGLLYLKSKSVRLPLISHILTDLGNLSIFLFMNLVQF